MQEQINDAKVQRARSAERVESLRKAASSANAEVERVQQQITKVESSRERALAQVAELEQRLSAVQSEQEEQAEPDTAERDRLGSELTSVRQEEMDAQLALRTAEERAPEILKLLCKTRQLSTAVCF